MKRDSSTSTASERLRDASLGQSPICNTSSSSNPCPLRPVTQKYSCQNQKWNKTVLEWQPRS